MDLIPDLGNHIRIFCSYADEDTKLLTRLQKHLGTLKTKGLIDNIYDSNTCVEQDFENETSVYINTSQIILLLISVDFLESRDCRFEMEQALQKRQEKTAWVIPVLLHPAVWKINQLTLLQPLPTDGKPITRWTNRESAFLDIVEGVERVIIDVWLNNGNKHYKDLEYQLALQAYRQVIDHCKPCDNDKKSMAHAHIGHVLYASHEYIQALEAYERAIGLGSQECLIYANMGHIFYAQHNHKEALKIYGQAMQRGSEDPLVYGNMGHIFYVMQDSKGALEFYEQAIQHDTPDPLVYIHKGEIYFHRKQYKDALKDIDFSLHLDPGNASAYHIKGEIHCALQEYKEAMRAYDQENRLNYGDPEDLLNNFKFYQETFQACRQIMQSDFETYPDQAKNNIVLKLKFWIEVFTTIWQVIKLTPNNAYTHNRRGRVLLKLERYKEALVAFEIAIQIEPENSVYYDNKGLALDHLHSYEEALGAYTKATKFAPADAQAWRNKGNALQSLNRDEEAKEAYEKANQLDSRSPDEMIIDPH